MHFFISSLCSFAQSFATFFRSFLCSARHLARNLSSQTCFLTPQMLSALAPIIESSPAALASSWHFFSSSSHFFFPSSLHFFLSSSAAPKPSSLHGSSVPSLVSFRHSSWNFTLSTSS